MIIRSPRARLKLELLTRQGQLQLQPYTYSICWRILVHLLPEHIDPSEIPLNMSTNFDSLLKVNLLEKHESFTNAEKAQLVILEDNKAAIDWAKKPGSGSRMKHLETELHWIKRAVNEKGNQASVLPD